MTDITDITDLPAVAGSPSPTPAAVDSVVISEQQVLFGSAPALARTPGRRLRWAAVARGWITDAREPARRHYPGRCAYLEDSLLSRECDRL